MLRVTRSDEFMMFQSINLASSVLQYPLRSSFKTAQTVLPSEVKKVEWVGGRENQPLSS